MTFKLLYNVILVYFRMQIKTEKEVISGIYDKNYSLFDLPCERLFILYLGDVVIVIEW